MLELYNSRLATCNSSQHELIAKFARVSTSLELPGVQYSGHILYLRLPARQCVMM